MNQRILFLSLLASVPVHAQGAPMQRVRVTVENLAPVQGTFQTPVWVAFHDGSFDIYDRGVPAAGPMAPVPNDAVERLAEDGDTSVIAAEFLASGAGTVEGTIVGSGGPYAPGDLGSQSFLVDPNDARSTYFSYASMLIPSNDAFLANGDPLAHQVFARGVFQGGSIFTGDVLDAGTELNDEVPANTAFLAQMAPNTGGTEGGVVMVHPGFLPVGSSGILDNPMFAEGDFTAAGYPTLKLRLESADAITQDRSHIAFLAGGHEVPAVATRARGDMVLRLENRGTQIRFMMFARGLVDVTGLHLHMAPTGENGPVVVDLLASNPLGATAPNRIDGVVTEQDLSGPLAAMPLDTLAAKMEAGEIYVNVHSTAFPSGELRGQVVLQR